MYGVCTYQYLTAFLFLWLFLFSRVFTNHYIIASNSFDHGLFLCVEILVTFVQALKCLKV